MAKTMPKVDVVLVGFGWTGAILAQQLCDAGMTVLALERAAARTEPQDFATTFDQDELRYMWRHHLWAWRSPRHRWKEWRGPGVSVEDRSSQVARVGGCVRHHRGGRGYRQP